MIMIIIIIIILFILYIYLKAVMAGLNHNTVIRLKPFWDKIDSRYTKIFKKIDSLLAPKNNYRKLKVFIIIIMTVFVE